MPQAGTAPSPELYGVALYGVALYGVALDDGLGDTVGTGALSLA